MKSDMASISIFSAISTAPPEINAPVGVSRLVAFAFGEDRECGRKGDQISAPLILIFIASRFVFDSKLCRRGTSSHLPDLPQALAHKRPMKAGTVTGTQGMRCSLGTPSLAPGLRSPRMRSRFANAFRLSHELRAAICPPRLILEMQPLDCLLS
jgi:hypothetical protein